MYMYCTSKFEAYTCIFQDTTTLNNPSVREVTVSSCSGTGTARGLAKLYGILANGGAVGGNTLLSRDSIKYLSTPVIHGKDAVMLTGEQTSFGPGTFYRRNPKVNPAYSRHVLFSSQI
jgi:hypothetical protein